MSNKLSFKLSDLKALLAVFENIAGLSEVFRQESLSNC